jgi:hypothetical protein
MNSLAPSFPFKAGPAKEKPLTLTPLSIYILFARPLIDYCLRLRGE